MPKTMPESDCLCPTCNKTLDKPEVQDVLERTVEAFHAAVKEHGITPGDALVASSFISAALADCIFDTGMPTSARQSQEARESFAVSFVCLVTDYLEVMMGVTFEDEDDEEDDADDEDAAAAEMEIFAALNTRH